MDYIDKINFNEYPVAAHFAIVQQKGYSYPRFRSHEKIKIPKANCEDKFRVTDIKKGDHVIGRLFILADGHGGPGCSEYFVRKTPVAVESLCQRYDPEALIDPEVQNNMQTEIKAMIQQLDEEYLSKKREELSQKKDDEHIDNDGCTLILNIFLGEWLINVNVGDSRTILISAPEPTPGKPDLVETGGLLGIDSDYKMDVVFASQDHKPYLEHLAREILENGGEFVDSVQNRVIKVDVDKLKEDGNRHAKRLALKNARIRPKGYNASHDAPCASSATDNQISDEFNPDEQSTDSAAVNGWTTQSAVRTTANNNSNNNNNNNNNTQQPSSPPSPKARRIPSLNVARSCGDLDFKMDPQHKIISCEPDVTFIRIKDQPHGEHTILLNGPHKEKRRHFLFMSTDGTFDYMYEETAERQNRAIAKVIGPMIEDGEKIGKYLLEEEERIKGETIEHNNEVENEERLSEKEEQENQGEQVEKEERKVKEEQDGEMSQVIVVKDKRGRREGSKGRDENKKEDDNARVVIESMEGDSKTEEKSSQKIKAEEEGFTDDGNKETNTEEPMEVDDNEKKEAPRIPLLYRELTEEEMQARKIKERTLVYSARYFANREGAQGFFASTLQDYDDCTIILVEI
ncbi:hypothetical protein RMCBS344292_02088 [Rhizopus microsporus]|nr:hypothetical protein RMCBS344292_02088 [Rhizopus microsporus]